MGIFDKKAMFLVVYMMALQVISIYQSRKNKIRALITKKAPSSVSEKYSDYVDIFSPDWIMKLSKHTKINHHIFNFVEEKHLFYDLIYSFSSIKLKTLKIYTENYLKIKLNCFFKFSAGAPILFDQKQEKNLYFCIDYY